MLRQSIPKLYISLTLGVTTVSKVEYLQSQALKLLGELDGSYDANKNGAKLARQFQRVVQEFKQAKTQSQPPVV